MSDLGDRILELPEIGWTPTGAIAAPARTLRVKAAPAGDAKLARVAVLRAGRFSDEQV